MLKSKTFFIFLLLNLAQNVWARSDFHNQLSYNFGVSNISVSDDNPNRATSDESKSISNMAFQFAWEFGHHGKWAYFTDAQIPLAKDNGSSLLSANFGFNYYLNDLGSKYTMVQQGTTIVIVPRFKYYIGGALGLGSLTLSNAIDNNTETYFSFGAHAGATYSLNDDWGLKGEVRYSRASGSDISGNKLDFMIGATYYL